MRYGAASYVERFVKNPAPTEGSDPWEWRNFAFAEVKKSGGLRKLEDVFAYKLDVQDIEGSGKLYHEAGLVVAYLMDGADGEKDVVKDFSAFKAALKAGVKVDVVTAAAALQKTLAKHEKDIKKFGGL